ncbi:MAG: autoinducer binding domain-containing protein [Burkholderiales bacterium]|nr:autoinducer binding domain-containing protein [Burkholderiales bacterium]
MERIWGEDLLSLLEENLDLASIFTRIESAAKSLDFEYCAYGMREAWPLTRPNIYLFNNYPTVWQTRYQKANYLTIDPTVQHCSQSQKPLLWQDDVFASHNEFWQDAQAAGLRVGWAQSSLDVQGGGCMLTLSRSRENLSRQELDAKLTRMRWLVNITHQCVKRAIVPSYKTTVASATLTPREIEVLKWTADGKTSNDISEILVISTDTVNFHVKNAVCKLAVPNKTAAVVRAYMLGLLA